MRHYFRTGLPRRRYAPPRNDLYFVIASIAKQSRLMADKDETIVKYSVLKESKQLFASKYKTVLPTEKELISFIERESREIKYEK